MAGDTVHETALRHMRQPGAKYDDGQLVNSFETMWRTYEDLVSLQYYSQDRANRVLWELSVKIIRHRPLAYGLMVLNYVTAIFLKLLLWFLLPAALILVVWKRGVGERQRTPAPAFWLAFLTAHLAILIVLTALFGFPFKRYLTPLMAVFGLWVPLLFARLAGRRGNPSA
ncbi:MAG: hypothetical protein M5R36_27285 [Deltaproteobacteria bacterium]|nr:hypothetical protein [Deltaproteobacteria bacterium]